MTRLIAVSIVCFVVALPAGAMARPRVALAPLDGDSSGDITDAVSDALDAGELAVVGPKQFTRALDKLGLDAGDLSDKSLKKLATELEADAVVQGSLSMKGGNHVLHIKLFVHGKKAKGFRVEFGSARSAKFKHALHDKLLAKLGLDKKAAEPDDDADDDAKPVKKKKHGGDDDAAAGGDDDSGKKTGGDDDASDDRPIKKKVASADDDSGGDVHASVVVGGGASAVRGANGAAARVDAGMSAVERKLSFTSKPGLMNAPPGYTNKPVPGARVAGSIYPLELAGRTGIASGLGIDFLYDKTLFLNLHNDVQPGTSFPANAYHYEVGPRFRYLFGASPTSMSLSVSVDYGHRAFIITNRSALTPPAMIDVPDVDYRGFTPSFELRVPLIPSIAMFVGGGALLATGTGAIQSTAQYGRAKVTEGEADIGFDIVFARRFALRLSGEFAQVGFAFTGNGAQSNDRDGDPSTPDVGGATDRYIGGAATLAVMY
jgi:hypothetical protein